MKDALSNDWLEETQSQLQGFRKEVTQSAEMSNHPEHSAMHKKHYAAMIKAVSAGE